MGFGRVVIAALCVVTLGGETMASNAGKNGRARIPSAPEVGEALHNGTGNLSKLHRDELVRKLGAIKNYLEASKATDTNAVQLLRFAAEVEKEVRTKKYGLVFEEHKERVDVELEHNLPVLTEDKKRFIDNGGEVNFLIEGDNLAALKLLEKTHRGRIDIVYLDPPYNTGRKDFIYNDSYVDATDTFRHSKWLSFMKKRLEVARLVMSEGAIILLSIDDNERANLELLCDDVFGRENFITTFVWQKKKGGGQAKYVYEGHEYVLAYARDKRVIGKLLVDDDKEMTGEKYLKRGEKTYFINDDFIRAVFGKYDAGAERRCHYEDILALKGKAKFDEVEEKLKRGEYILRESDSDPKKHYVCRLEDVSEGKKKVVYSVISGIRTEDGNNEIKEMGLSFDNPKPIALMEMILNLTQNKKAQVLDFFAGSGTTGHAVMNLNAKDGGKRKFILVTNNENGICEKVTYERLKRVIEKENYAARLKYYKIGYVPIDEKVYYEYANDLLKHIRELVELENAVDFSKDKTVAIALTDKELEKFVGNDKRLEVCKAVYVGHDVLISSAIKATLKKHGVKVNIIPQYYYPELEG